MAYLEYGDGENRDTRCSIDQKFDEKETKKVNVCEGTSGRHPKGLSEPESKSMETLARASPPKWQSNDQGSSRLEAMLEKALANQTKSEKKLSRLTATVESHTKSIQKLASQMCDISREQHPPKKGGLPSDTISNPKNGGGSVDRVFSISTKSGKILQSTKRNVVDLEPINEEEEVQSNAPIIVDEVTREEKNADIPESSKVAGDKSKQTLKQLSLNFSFLDVVKKMDGFAKYLKDILTKKKTVQNETISLSHTVSSIISTNTVQKKRDLGAFTIPCSVGYHNFARALCDNGVIINLMPLAIYKQLGLGMPRPTTMRLQMADRSIKLPVGVVDEVLVWVGKFMLLDDFVILDYAFDRDIPIILGRPFLATGRTLMDSEKNEIKF
ncbi:uncharacterized protein LOC132042471 [Lycium ferocissimum]|uniref:uncharacterized protein LOC132042471 n=1 Tax=Lycium ferocissimum TaxID=112874 RepID=UPI002814FD69|nr:uncharacterized protein LOC132042471 [Lycium ferocissimum]